MEVFTVLKLGKWVKFHQSKYINLQQHITSEFDPHLLYCKRDNN